MELFEPWSLLSALLGLLFMGWAFKILERTWLTPRRLDRLLRSQGLDGTAYRFLSGDVKETVRLNREARAKPMAFSHDITPRVVPFLRRTIEEHGKLSFTWFGPYPRINVMDPELVREILSNKFGHFGKQKISRLGRLLADGLVNYEGEKWAKHRRILNPAFHVEKLKRMLPAFFTCCEELVDRWQNSVGPNCLFELDVWPELQNLTGDVISRAAFGSNYQEGRRIFQLQGELGERLVKAFQTIYIPGYWFLPTANNRRMKGIDREIRTLLRGIIGKREKAIQNGESTNDDLLGLLLESNMRETGGMSKDEIIEECKLFYFAGQETTSILLTWTMVVLSMHPEWQEKARKEVLQHFGKNKPDFDGLSRLKIVTMVLYEVLRIYPPIVQIGRRTYKTMQLGNMTLPPGVLLGLSILLIHHDKEVWGNDATEFKPERFVEGISKAASKDGHVAFFPFGWGPRICIGQNFALLEAKMGLSMILQKFSFELSPSYVHAPYQLLTLHPQYGAQIRFHRLG